MIKPNISSYSDLVKKTNFSNVLSFDRLIQSQANYQITSSLNITIDPTNAIAGAVTSQRLIANGNNLHTPVFIGLKQSTGSSGWDNRSGIINVVQYYYDGYDYWYSIMQELGAIPLDIAPPVLSSSNVNGAGTVVNLIFNEPLLASSLPSASDFTGATVTSTSILANTLTLNISPALTPNVNVNITYAGTSIKDFSSNNAAGFVATVNSSGLVPVILNSRAATISEVTAGTYKQNNTTPNWDGAISTTKTFIGNAIYQVSSPVNTAQGFILGLEGTSTSISSLATFANIDFGVFHSGGSYYRIENGNLILVPAVNGDKVRLKRVGSTITAEYERTAGTWVNLYTYTATTNAPLAPVLYLYATNSEATVGYIQN
jgi:hypothetical protein